MIIGQIKRRDRYQSRSSGVGVRMEKPLGRASGLLAIASSEASFLCLGACIQELSFIHALIFRAGSRAEFVAVAGPSCSAAAGVAARSVAAGSAQSLGPVAV